MLKLKRRHFDQEYPRRSNRALLTERDWNVDVSVICRDQGGLAARPGTEFT